MVKRLRSTNFSETKAKFNSTFIRTWSHLIVDCSMMFCFYFYLSNPKENCNREKKFINLPSSTCFMLWWNPNWVFYNSEKSPQDWTCWWLPIVVLHLQLSQTTNSRNFQEQIVSRRERRIFLQKKYERERKLLIFNFEKVCNNSERYEKELMMIWHGKGILV